jgi:NADPH:quinone reductase-like Zn-dependent oxidoreductase
MKAILNRAYGTPDTMTPLDVDTPTPGQGEVLVRVVASSVNPYDWHYRTGTPYVMRLANGVRRPRRPAAGIDFAGRVHAVGPGVTGWRCGDEVFGAQVGAHAEYVVVAAGGVILPTPTRLTFEQAAAVPLAALTALQGLRHKGGVRPGDRVLVIGAAGGVGTFAVQIAAAFGAEVTGVCSTGNVDLVRSLGAARVIDYTREDFAADGSRYDLILDNVGTRSLADRRRVLAAAGRLVAISGPKTNRWLGPVSATIRLLVAARFARQAMGPMLTRMVRDDLATVADLIEAGRVTPAIDRVYRWEELPAALAYVGTGHARAKVVVTGTAAD